MSQSRRRILWASGLLGTVCLLASCNVVAPIFYIVHGPPKTEAVFELPDRSTVVFVDDRDNHINRSSQALRALIADTTSTELMKHEVLTETIRPTDAMGVARQNDRYKAIMPIDAIGRAVGADQVIYVEMLEFKTTPDGYTPRPMCAFGVKVVDVESKTRLFPPPDSGEDTHVVTFSSQPIDPSQYNSQADLHKVYQLMAAETADHIAKLFYTHETKELGGQLDPG